MRWPQESLAAAFFSLFPQGVFCDLHFPCVEDLVNGDTFVESFAWADDRDIDEYAASACSSMQWDVPAQRHMQRG